jgi:pimeloyl-ACP methyl ester carboxylesterase
MVIQINGLNIDYETQGQGKNLLLLHGWGCTKDIFACITNELNKRLRITALDFPGFGKSDTPPETWGVPEYMELTAKFIRRNGLEGTDILCHSFGGRVAIMLAARYPELVGKIIFTGSAGFVKKRTLKYYIRAYRFKLMKKIAKGKTVKKLLKALGVDVEARIKNAGSADYRALSDSMKKVFVRVVNLDLREYLKDIKASSLLIWGENDTETPVEFGRLMEKNIKDSGLVVLPDAGHYAFLDQYARFMAIIKNFLEV